MMNERTLLFVDDEIPIIKTILRQFRNADFKLLTANNAKDALHLLELNDVNVLITDERMPGMNGIDLIKITKEKYPDVVRIMLSGYANSEVIKEAVKNKDIYSFLFKPWTKEKVSSVINEAFILSEELHLKNNNELRDAQGLIEIDIED